MNQEMQDAVGSYCSHIKMRLSNESTGIRECLLRKEDE